MRNLSYKTYLDKVYGCFIGKAVSGNIGAPHEGVKMPMELPFMPEMINCELPNDDLDLQILWLDVLEQKGAALCAVRAEGPHPALGGAFCFVSCPIRRKR